MNWFFLALAGGLSSSIFNFTNRHVLKTNGDSTSYSWWFEFFRTLIFMVFILCGIKSITDFNFAKSYLLVLIGLVEFVTIFVYMKMHARNELSVSSIVIQLRTIWVPLVAFLFLDEVLRHQEYMGIFLVFLGQILVVSPRKFKGDKGIFYAFLASFLTSLNTVVMKEGLNYFSVPLVVSAMGLPTIIGYPFVMKGGIERILRTGRQVGKKIMGAAIFNSLAMYFLASALAIESAGKVSGVYQSMTIVTVLAGIFILKERKKTLRKLVGALVAIAGIALLV